ncbi:probable RNA methyltransferase Y17G7B.18 [Branchiostoma floridae]|uniref:RNA methyltransferase n=3 Tax=Branchiostoma floridae TaxID=7739 RepID=A0A9J7MAV1_BRAFL|nr:probable RNA methyltransferase Y17G7B.18 [Branchiostoma floridae]
MAATESIVASQEVNVSMDILDGKQTLLEVVEEVEGQSQELANHGRDGLSTPEARGDGQSFLPNQERDGKNGATSQVRPANHHADRNQPLGRGHFKRRHASSSHFKRGGPHHLKWRRKTVETEPIVLPSDFLLGGNITDPLNLNSMQDEEVNRMLNAKTPTSSPLPNRTVVGDVGLIIPGDVTDPLHLNQTPRSGKKRRHKRRRRRSEGDLDDSEHYIDEEATEGITTGCKPLVMDSKESFSKEGCPEHIPEGKDKEKERVSPKDKVSPVSFSHGHKRTRHNSGRTDDGQVTPVSDTNHTPKRRSKSGEKEMIPMEEIVSPVISPDHEKRRGVEPTRIVSRALLIENHPSTKEHRSHRRTPDKGRGNHVGSQHKKQPEQGAPSAPHFRPKDQVFQYGNYDRYYGYRNPAKEEDVRLSYFRPDWFKNLDVLDIGCNAGHLTLSIARDYAPRKIVGMDIDQNLIRVARRNIRHYLAPEARDSFPVSMAIQYGPMAAGGLVGDQVATQFPNNVFFTQANYVPDSDSRVQSQQPEYDVILALSLTKWIHLNWGDAAMKRTFQRVFRQLRPGGRFIVEPQPWKSYGRKKKLTERIFTNYKQIQFRPHQFVAYLLSAEVGFSSCRQLEGPRNKSKGFHRPVYMLTKSPAAPP